MRRLFILLALLPVVLFAASLTDGGRIATNFTPQRNDFVELHECAGGTLHIQHFDHQPVTIRLFSHEDAQLGEWTYRQAIDPVFSPNRRWLAFSTCDAVRILDTANGVMAASQPADVFTIDNDGRLAYWRCDRGEICYSGQTTPVDGIVRGMYAHEGEIIVHTRDRLLILSDNATLYQSRGALHDVAWEDDILYVSEKRPDGYHLIRVSDGAELESRLTPASCAGRTHQPVPAPLHYGEPDYPHPIGNTYLEYQNYGGTPYLHPGVDFLGQAYDQVYAVEDGVVKAVLSTGGELYWRVAVALEDTADECEGYLYAHLNQGSITVAEGDSVHAGDVLGTLVDWPVASFHHCHYARIQDSGTVWNGDWWTVDDPLRDTYDHLDITPPEFENALADDIFAFRVSNNNYADPSALSGEVDIIAHAHDIINSDWRCTINRIGYRLTEASNPDSVLIDQLSFTFDYPNDTYGTGTYDWQCLTTIFCRDNTCSTDANYETREYYYVLSHADADSSITDDDINQRFDTTLLDDGTYLLEVWAEDGASNVTTSSMYITIENSIDDPPVFIDLPSLMFVAADSITLYPLWEHVEDDNTPDDELEIEFSAANQYLNWSFNDTTGVLSLWHTALETQTAPFEISVTDNIGQNTQSSINLVLDEPVAVDGEVDRYPLTLSCSPNPFNPSTTVRYSLPQDSDVRLTAYNVRGQCVGELMRARQSAGQHEFTWNATDCASGVYLLRLSAGGRVVSQRVLLLK